MCTVNDRDFGIFSWIRKWYCSLLYAFENSLFVHCDTHYGNILLKKTKIQSIEYGNRQTLPVLGTLPVVMDFDRSVIQTDNQNCALVYGDIGRIMNLARSEIDVKLNISNDIPNRYIMNKTPVTKSVYDELCNYIDSRQIDYVMSEKQLRWWTKLHIKHLANSLHYFVCILYTTRADLSTRQEPYLEPARFHHAYNTIHSLDFTLTTFCFHQNHNQSFSKLSRYFGLSEGMG